MRIRKAMQSDVDQAVEFAYRFQTSPQTRCRPLLVTSTKQQIYDVFKIYIERDSRDVLLVEQDGKLQGLSPLYWIAEDNYVAFKQGPYGDVFQTVASILYAYVEKNFKGYAFYVNAAPEHYMANQFYQQHNFDQIEQAVMLKLERVKCDYTHPRIQILNHHNREEFYQWIDQHIDEITYWNAARIHQNLDEFIILGYFDDAIKGHIIGRGAKAYSEIIALTGDDKIKERLIKSFITIAYQEQVTFIDLYTESDQDVALGERCGFEIYDNNNCYLKQL